MRANVHARMRTTMNTNAPHQHASMCIRRRLRMCALACAGAGRDVECATCRNVQRVMCHTQYAVCVVRCASCMRHAASNDQGVASRAPHSGFALMLRQLRARAPWVRAFVSASCCVLRARRAARIDAQTCAYVRRYCISAKCILHVRVPSAPLQVKMCGCVYLSM
jgi:ribosomal protein S27E